MMADPEKATPSTQEETFEWIVEDGKVVKITEKNSKGRMCSCCGCKCPCRCACCKMMCCSFKKGMTAK